MITINSFDDKNEFHKLFQSYLHDLSRYNPNLVLNESGLFDATWIDKDWDLPEFIPLCIEQNHTISGFIILTKEPFSKPGVQYCIQEFFILKGLRKQRIGVTAIEQLFKNYSGSYSMVVIKDNLPAKLFWENTLNRMRIQYIKETYIEEGVDGLSYEFTVL